MKIRGQYLHSLAVVFILFLLPAQGQPVSAPQVPFLRGRVVDSANILSAGSVNALNQQLQQLETQDSTQIVVLTIDSLQGESLEQYSLKVAETWKIGQKERDNGALLLVVVNDRKVRIEVGYGLEGRLTDLISGRIIDNIIVPEFRQGQYNQGILNGVDAMVKTVKGEYTAKNLPARKQRQDPGAMLVLTVFALLLISRVFHKKKVAGGIAGGVTGAFLWLITPLLSGVAALLVCLVFGIVGGVLATAFSGISGMHKVSSGGMRYRGFGGGGGLGGGFSGGGGSFGGGGASGGW